METFFLSEPKSFPPDSILPIPQHQTPPSPNSMPFLAETLDDPSSSSSSAPNGDNQTGSSPQDQETLDGSSPCSQSEDMNECGLVPVLQNEDGSSAESLALQEGPPEVEATRPSSPLNCNELLSGDPNLNSESSEPSGWSSWSRGPSCSKKRSSHFSEHFSIEELATPNMVGAGLYNLGNTCFINAILQCITHTVPLVEGLRSSNHPLPCDFASYRFCVVCALREQVDLSIASSGGVLSPFTLVDNLNHFSSYFRRYQQENAHEFLQCVLDKLERSWLDSDKKKETSSCKDKNLVERVFYMLSTRLLQGQPGQVFLVPYNSGDHWELSVIMLDEGIVYHLDPSRRRLPVGEWRTIVDNAIVIYNANVKNKSRKSITWKPLSGIPPQQGRGCGLWVMLYMNDIVNDKNLGFATKWEVRKGRKQQVYTATEIDAVRNEWANYVSSIQFVK